VLPCLLLPSHVSLALGCWLLMRPQISQIKSPFLEMKNVSFAYTVGKPILENVTCQLGSSAPPVGWGVRMRQHTSGVAALLTLCLSPVRVQACAARSLWLGAMARASRHC